MKRRNLGFVFLFISILLSFFSTSFTGAVVGNQENLLSTPWVSILFFLVGIGLLISTSPSLDDLVSNGVANPLESARRLNNIPGERKVLVLDTSYIGEYNRRHIGELFGNLDRGYHEIVIPNAVLNEIQRGPRRDALPLLKSNPYFKEQPDTRAYFSIAKSYLEKSDKKIIKDKIVPIITGKVAAPSMRRDALPLANEARKILGWLRDDGFAVTRENILKVLDRHYEVSPGDVEVLASAMVMASKDPNEQVVIATNDRDFGYALDLMKNGGEGLKPHELGRRITYSTSQARAA